MSVCSLLSGFYFFIVDIALDLLSFLRVCIVILSSFLKSGLMNCS